MQRWRILNASNARFYKLSLESHNLHLIGTDGGLLDKPYPRSEILLSPGERVDVLVKGTAKSGNYRLRALPYARMGIDELADDHADDRDLQRRHTRPGAADGHQPGRRMARSESTDDRRRIAP